MHKEPSPQTRIQPPQFFVHMLHPPPNGGKRERGRDCVSTRILAPCQRRAKRENKTNQPGDTLDTCLPGNQAICLEDGSVVVVVFKGKLIVLMKVTAGRLPDVTGHSCMEITHKRLADVNGRTEMDD